VTSVHQLGEVVIIGGGCYGSFYLGQLLKAREAGAVTWRQVIVVDHNAVCTAASMLMPDVALYVQDWGEFLDSWLDRTQRTSADRLVPSPLMPHLMAEWLLRRARKAFGSERAALVPATLPAGTPFDMLHPADGVRYLSHADWTCPVHCVEPATCPMIKAPRQWEMSETVTAWTEEHRRNGPTAGPVLFTCRHLTHGVGMYPVIQSFEALDELEALVANEGRGDLVVGSISACHGAIGVLRIGEKREARGDSACRPSTTVGEPVGAGGCSR
jgi:hypothetical protein